MPRRSSLAMVQTGPGVLEPRELPLPEIGPDDGLLRVEACGICGSDHEQFRGALPVRYPVIPGHEPVGIVEAVGDRAAERWGVEVGDRVAVETMIGCHACGTCLAGHYHLCRRRRIYSYIGVDEPPGLWGAYAEYLYLAPGAVLHKMAPDLPAEIAVIFNPLGAGFRWGVEMPGSGPGTSVLVLGPGQRGLSAVVACRAAGAERIAVTGLAADARKLALARELGAGLTLDVEAEDVRARVREFTGGRGADVVLDVSAWATGPVAEALDCVAVGGTVVLAGVKGMKPVPDFVSDKIVLKEITVKGAMGVTHSAYEKAIRLLEAGGSGIERMHTHTFDLREAEHAIRLLGREIPGEESIHSCLIPGRA